MEKLQISLLEEMKYERTKGEKKRRQTRRKGMVVDFVLK
jgi:hypothetical protein